jgi:hypothetical protein
MYLAIVDEARQRVEQGEDGDDRDRKLAT